MRSNLHLRIVVAVMALALLPAAAAQAAPKKVRFSFSSAVASVNEGAGTYNLAVSRSLNTRTTASVNLAVDPSSTAVPGTDYTFTNPGTITFNPGETRKTFPVTIVDDQQFNRPNKKIVFKLSGAPAGSQLKNNPETLTILDNDGPGTIDLSSPTYSVVESAGAATVTVSREGNLLIPESVDYATSGGSATAGSDYTSTSGTLTFSAGVSTQSFQVPITDDQAFEGDETLNVALSNATNLNSSDPNLQPNLGPNTPATLTIVDDDVPTFTFHSATYSAGEGDGHATITVDRGGATYVPATVSYSTTDGSATAGSDYTAASGTLAFAAGETQKSFQVPITDDSAAEATETVNLHLSFQSQEVSTALLSILDNDPGGNPAPSVQFSDSNFDVNEADGTATVTVTISHAADVDVDYATSDGNATAGSDYTAASGTVHFTSGGATSQTFTVPILQDTLVEDPETVNLTLSGPTGGALLGSPNPSTITIADDDGTGTLEFSSQRYDVNETAGRATITVNRVGGSGGPASVDYTTSDGTAHAPDDYTATSGTLSFADGETQKTFDIPVAWDGRQEGDETVSIILSNFASDDTVDSKAAVLHIADDGASGPVQFDAPSYTVAENGGAATITVTRSGGSLGGPVTVDYATSDGTAHAGADYSASSGTLTFGPGEASKAFQVPVNDDNVHQGSRSLNVTLSNAGGGTSVGSQGSAAVTITDNDPAGPASADKTPPNLKLTAKKVQKLKTKRIVLKVHSNEAAKLAITVKFRKGAKHKVVIVKRASKRVGAGKTVTIKLKLTKKQLATLRRSLVHHKRKLTLSVKGTDAAGNSRTVSRTITVK